MYRLCTLVIGLLGICSGVHGHTVTLTKNDPFPLYSTEFPYSFLYNGNKDIQTGRDHKAPKLQRLQFTLSAFGQKAERGRNLNKERADLGDLEGRWNFLGMLYGSLPTGVTTRGATLDAAALRTYSTGAFLTDTAFSDTTENFGYVSAPLKYRKIGLRGQFMLRLWKDFGITVNGGITELKQAFTDFADRTTSTYVTNVSGTNLATVQDAVIDKIDTILDELSLSKANFHEVTAEDVNVSLWWRRAFAANTDAGKDWAPFLLIPFLSIDGTIAIGKKKDQTKLFSLPSGNNGHHAIGLRGGFSFDFFDTVEVGVEGGFKHFFKESFSNYRVPTSSYQSGIFPFATDVTIKPGQSWHTSVFMNARHFIDRLSCYVQYVFASHTKDAITVVNGDSAFKPGVLNDRSKWSAQFINASLTYDVSRTISAGLTWQAPLAQRNAYRTNMLMASLITTF